MIWGTFIPTLIHLYPTLFQKYFEGLKKIDTAGYKNKISCYRLVTELVLSFLEAKAKRESWAIIRCIVFARYQLLPGNTIFPALSSKWTLSHPQQYLYRTAASDPAWWYKPGHHTWGLLNDPNKVGFCWSGLIHRWDFTHRNQMKCISLSVTVDA